MECRQECGACCIVPAINRPFYGMPDGKKAGERCVHLLADYRCKLFNDARRPDCCGMFQAETAFCGNDRERAIQLLWELEHNSG